MGAAAAVLATLFVATAAGCGSAQLRSDDAIIAASRVEVVGFEETQAGWRLAYRSKTDDALSCTANGVWHEEHPPGDEVGSVTVTFTVPPRGQVSAELPLPARFLADPSRTRPGRIRYALVEVADRDGLYLVCTPPRPR